jgi:hypothetical protein
VTGKIGQHDLEVVLEYLCDACPGGAGLGEAVDEHDGRPVPLSGCVQPKHATLVERFAVEGHRS